MTDSMIERVARDIEHVIREFSDKSPQMVAKIAATVAIAAMRVPTDAMHIAGRQETDLDKFREGRIYRAMIDAALNEKAGT